MQSGVVDGDGRPVDRMDFDQMSLFTGLTCDPKEDRADQSQKMNQDLNVILERFRATGQLPTVRVLEYGERDFSLDLMGAYAAVEAAERTYAELPAELKKEYPTWQAFVEAMRSGKLELVASDKSAASPSVVDGEGGDSASDSAPVS